MKATFQVRSINKLEASCLNGQDAQFFVKICDPANENACVQTKCLSGNEWKETLNWDIDHSLTQVKILLSSKIDSSVKVLSTTTIQLPPPEIEIDEWYTLSPEDGCEAGGELELTIKIVEKKEALDNTLRKSQTIVKSKEARNKERAALLEVDYDEIYQKATVEAKDIYGALLESSAQELLENEQKVKGSDEKNTEAA